MNHCFKYSSFVFGEERLVKKDGDPTFDTDLLVVEVGQELTERLSVQNGVEMLPSMMVFDGVSFNTSLIG